MTPSQSSRESCKAKSSKHADGASAPMLLLNAIPGVVYEDEEIGRDKKRGGFWLNTLPVSQECVVVDQAQNMHATDKKMTWQSNGITHVYRAPKIKMMAADSRNSRVQRRVVLKLVSPRPSQTNTTPRGAKLTSLSIPMDPCNEPAQPWPMLEAERGRCDPMRRDGQPIHYDPTPQVLAR